MHWSIDPSVDRLDSHFPNPFMYTYITHTHPLTLTMCPLVTAAGVRSSACDAIASIQSLCVWTLGVDSLRSMYTRSILRVGVDGGLWWAVGGWIIDHRTQARSPTSKIDRPIHHNPDFHRGGSTTPCWQAPELCRPMQSRGARSMVCMAAVVSKGQAEAEAEAEAAKALSPRNR
jgi:hypothetical protein